MNSSQTSTFSFKDRLLSFSPDFRNRLKLLKKSPFHSKLKNLLRDIKLKGRSMIPHEGELLLRLCEDQFHPLLFDPNLFTFIDVHEYICATYNAFIIDPIASFSRYTKKIYFPLDEQNSIRDVLRCLYDSYDLQKHTTLVDSINNKDVYMNSDNEVVDTSTTVVDIIETNSNELVSVDVDTGKEEWFDLVDFSEYDGTLSSLNPTLPDHITTSDLADAFDGSFYCPPNLKTGLDNMLPTVVTEMGFKHQFNDTSELESYISKLEQSNSHYLLTYTPNLLLAGGGRRKGKRRKGKKRGKRKGGGLISMKGDQRGVIVPNPTITCYFRKSVDITTDAAGRFSIYGALRSVTQAYNNANSFDRAQDYANLYDTYKPMGIKLYMTLQAPIIAATGRIGTAVDFDHTPPQSFVIDDLVASANYREHLARGVIDINFPLRKRTITEGEYTPNGADPSIAIIHQGGFMDFATPVTTGTWFLAGDNLPPTSRVGTLIITMKAKCRDSRTIGNIVKRRLAKDPNQQLPEVIGLSLPVNPLDPDDDDVLHDAAIPIAHQVALSVLQNTNTRRPSPLVPPTPIKRQL